MVCWSLPGIQIWNFQIPGQDGYNSGIFAQRFDVFCYEIGEKFEVLPKVQQKSLGKVSG